MEWVCFSLKKEYTNPKKINPNESGHINGAPK
jgi:hypothetical protein